MFGGPVPSIRLEPVSCGTVVSSYRVTHRLPVFRQFSVPVVLSTEVPTVSYLFLVDPVRLQLELEDLRVVLF